MVGSIEGRKEKLTQVWFKRVDEKNFNDFFSYIKLFPSNSSKIEGEQNEL